MFEREELWASLNQPWDLLIIGGGITGAGILREVVRRAQGAGEENPLRVLLVEQRDFAWGTSSRSSKLVHGGLRYLKQGQVNMTLVSVQERQHLLQEGPGLVDPLGFLLTVYEGDNPGRWIFEVGLTIYDLLALQWEHRYYSPQDLRLLAPHIAENALQGGFRYGDAQTDDARLVLRLISEAQHDGGCAVNYTQAVRLVQGENGQVAGAVLRDNLTGQEQEVRAQAVVNATGAWADLLRKQMGEASRLRPLRGSHLVFPAWRLPVAQAVSFLHPLDQRPVFIFPWEGVTLVGTTDVDHGGEVHTDRDPAISGDEVAYLMAAAESQFPSLNLGLEDILATFAGVRPVIGTGKADPSQESRDHVVWDEHGLLTVTGGKLTTFRIIARDALNALRSRLPRLPDLAANTPVLAPVNVELPGAENLDEAQRRRLLGRYGTEAAALVRLAQPGELQRIPGTETLWGELRWAAHREQVAHLDDLLLRRVRLGLTLPGGGREILPAVRMICQTELGWNDARWQEEESHYRELWQASHGLPPQNLIPNWKDLLAQARAARSIQRQKTAQRRNRALLAASLAAAAGLLAGWLVFLYSRRKRA